MSRTLSTKPLLSRSLFSTSANCSSRRRCSRVSVVGVMTVTETQVTWLTQEAHDRLKGELDELPAVAAAGARNGVVLDDA